MKKKKVSIKNGGMKDECIEKKEINTVDDIYALPDGKRAELIDGKIYYMAPPSWKHQSISRKLHQLIANYIDSNDGKCEALAAPFAVFLSDDNVKETLINSLYSQNYPALSSF